MKKREQQFIVTFYTTADAMAMEQACRKSGAPGRMIPVPRTLSAGCGLAWAADPEDEPTLRAVIEQAGIEPEEALLCML